MVNCTSDTLDRYHFPALAQNAYEFTLNTDSRPPYLQACADLENFLKRGGGTR